MTALMQQTVAVKIDAIGAAPHLSNGMNAQDAHGYRPPLDTRSATLRPGL